MDGDNDIKEWVRAARPAKGLTVVTVTLQQGNISAKWSTHAFGKIKEGVAEARKQALIMLDELSEALA